MEREVKIDLQLLMKVIEEVEYNGCETVVNLERTMSFLSDIEKQVKEKRK
jgi:hypothetical protein